MAVHDELEAILARLQRMREELRLDVAANGEAASVEASRDDGRAENASITEGSAMPDGPVRHDEA